MRFSAITSLVCSARCAWAVLVAVAFLFASASTAQAAPALTSTFVGEKPNGAGVFRFPQAVATTPDGSTVFVADQYSGSVQAFDAAGNHKFSFGYRAIRNEGGRLGVVGGLAVDRANRVYVLDSENKRVQVFSATDGSYITRFGNSSLMNTFIGSTPEAGINVGGVAVYQASPDASPDFYIADSGNDRVIHLKLDPRTAKPVGDPQFNGPDISPQAPQGLTVDPSGKFLYVADDQRHQILKLDSQTLALLSAVGSNGTAPGQFRAPYDVAVDKTDKLYVGDNLNGRVGVFEANTLTYLSMIGVDGHALGEFSIVRALAADPAAGGGVYVGDTANNRIQRWDGGGNLIGAWGIAGRGPGYFTRPGGAAFDPTGGIAVADTFAHRIERFAADGTMVGQYGTPNRSTLFAGPGSTPGRIDSPSDVAVGQDGSLWITDTDNDRLVGVDPSNNQSYLSPAGLLSKPSSIDIAADGTLVIADRNNNQILKGNAASGFTKVPVAITKPTAVAVNASGIAFAAESTKVIKLNDGSSVAAPDSGGWKQVSGLALAVDGTLYVSEQRTSVANGARILRGTPNGGGYSWDVIASEGNGDSNVVSPGNLSVSSDGKTLLVADSGNNRVLRFAVDASTFPQLKRLNVAISGPIAQGTVTSDLPGIICGTDCSQGYGTGRQVTLTATPRAGGPVFAGWEGACAAAGTNNTCTVTLSGDQNVTAKFNAQPLPPAPSPPPPTPSVRLKNVSLSSTKWSIKGKKNATKARLRFTVSRAATVRISVLVKKKGVLKGASCVRATAKASKKKKACTRWVKQSGSLTYKATTAKSVSIKLKRKVAKKYLGVGQYRLSLAASDSSKNIVTATTKTFKVTK